MNGKIVIELVDPVYTVEVHANPIDGGYFAVSNKTPKFCLNGHTPADALKKAADAISFYESRSENNNGTDD